MNGSRLPSRVYQPAICRTHNGQPAVRPIPLGWGSKRMPMDFPPRKDVQNPKEVPTQGMDDPQPNTPRDPAPAAGSPVMADIPQPALPPILHEDMEDIPQEKPVEEPPVDLPPFPAIIRGIRYAPPPDEGLPSPSAGEPPPSCHKPDPSPLWPSLAYQQGIDPRGEGLLAFQKWWFLNDIAIRVDGERLEGTPIALLDNTLRLVGREKSYFIPLRQVQYIETPNGMDNYMKG